MIFLGAFGPGMGALGGEFYVALAALLSTALTIGYTMSAMRRIFYGPLPENLADVKEASWTYTVPMIILCALSILLGLAPAYVVNPLMEAVAGLLA